MSALLSRNKAVTKPPKPEDVSHVIRGWANGFRKECIALVGPEATAAEFRAQAECAERELKEERESHEEHPHDERRFDAA